MCSRRCPKKMRTHRGSFIPRPICADVASGMSGHAGQNPSYVLSIFAFAGGKTPHWSTILWYTESGFRCPSVCGQVKLAELNGSHLSFGRLSITENINGRKLANECVRYILFDIYKSSSGNFSGDSDDVQNILFGNNKNERRKEWKSVDKCM